MDKIFPMVKLGAVLTERREVPSADALARGTMRVIDKIGFNEGRIELRPDSFTNTKMILIRPGDLVVSGINAYKGAVAVYQDKEDRNPIAATIHYGAYVPDKNKVDVFFLWWLLRSNTFKKLLEEYVPGGIKTELKAKRLLSVPIPLPVLEEQQRITAYIVQLASKIEKARGLRRQATEAINGLLESHIDHILSRFPESCRFEEVITFKPRSGPSFPTHPDWEGTPVLMPSAVTGFGVDITKIEFGMGDERISEKDLLKQGDILIARGNKREQVGNAGVVPEEANGWVYANLLMRLQVDITRVDPSFCIYWLRSPRMRSLIKQCMTGTNPNIQKINQRAILGFPFPAQIPLNEQHQIVAHLDDVQAKVDALKRLQAQTSADLDAMLPSILDKAFKGEL